MERTSRASWALIGNWCYLVTEKKKKRKKKKKNLNFHRTPLNRQNDLSLSFSIKRWEGKKKNHAQESLQDRFENRKEGKEKKRKGKRGNFVIARAENKAENRTEQLDDCLTELHAP